MTRKLMSIMVCLFVVVSIASVASAISSTSWTGTTGAWTDSTWTLDANNNPILPNGNNVTIGDANDLGGTVAISGAATPLNLNVGYNGTATLNAGVTLTTNTLSVGYYGGGNGYFNNLGGSIVLAGALNVGDGTTNAGGTFNQTGGYTSFGSTSEPSGNGVMAISGGVVSCTGKFYQGGLNSALLMSGSGTFILGNNREYYMGRDTSGGLCYASIQGNSRLEITGNAWSIGNNVAGQYTVDQGGGTVKSDTDAIIVGDAYAATYNLSGGLLSASTTIRIGNNSSGTSLLNMTGGSATAPAVDFNTKGNAGANVALNLQDGRIAVTTIQSGSGAGTRALNLTGGTLAFHSITSTAISASTLTDNGSTIELGTVAGAIDNVQFNKGYTQNSGNLEVDIASLSSFDKMTFWVGGAQLLGGAVDVHLEGGYTPNMGDQFVIALGNAAAAVSGVTIDPSWSIGTDGGNNVVLTYVPEPATMSLLGLGALALLRRKKA